MAARNNQRPAAMMQQRTHHAAIETRERILRMFRMQVLSTGGCNGSFGQRPVFPADTKQAHGRPWRDHERDRQGETHRGAGANGDRPHVGAHQAPDERHGQHGGDHGESGQDRGIADLVDGLDRDVIPGAPPVLRQVKVPHDVLHDHDRIIHENADAEDEREERDAVQGESSEVEDQQREGERRGNGHANDAGLAPAERQPDQDHHPGHGDAHVQEKFVGLLRGGLAVVAGDAHRDVGRDDSALERIHLAQHIVRDRNCVRAGPLGDAQRHGSLFAARAPTAEKHVVRGLLGAVHDLGNFLQIDRPAAGNAYDDIADVDRRLQKSPGLHDDGLVAAGELPGAKLAVRLLEHRNQPGGAEIAGRELHGIEQHPQLAPRPADDRGLGDLGHLLDRVIDLGDETTQREMIITRAVKREGEDGHVVDRPRLDERPDDAVRDAVEV